MGFVKSQNVTRIIRLTGPGLWDIVGLTKENK